MDVEQAKKEILDVITEEFGGGLSSVVALEMSNEVNGGALAALCTEENIRKFADELFLRADKNGDKTISFEEFETFIHHHASQTPSERIGLSIVTGDELIEEIDKRCSL